LARVKFQKRRYDLFVSYGDADVARVEPVVRLLAGKAGLEVWFDGEAGNAATRSSELLSGAIENSRAAIFLLSEGWTGSTWCKGEYNKSLVEQRAEEEFAIVAARLDEVEAPGWFEIAEIVDLREISPRAIVRLLSSLGGSEPRRVDNAYDVYLSAPWSKPTALTDLALSAVKRSDLAWRLIGDAPNYKHLREERVEDIVRTTRGMVAVLPFDANRGVEKTSPFILEEAGIARATGKPLLMLSEPGVVVPRDLAVYAFCSMTLAPSADAKTDLLDALNDFDEIMQQFPEDDTGTFIFYAGSLKAKTDGLKAVIERGSNMPFEMGEGLSGVNAPKGIIDLIRRAALVIADVSDDRRNTMIEVGAAMALNKQLRLLVKNDPPGATPKKAFMLEGREVFGYDNAQEHLGLCYNFARQYRRKVYSS
jgi:hypothetical protein